MRVKLTLAYDGTAFAGWQIQARAAGPRPRTVQGCLEAALERICGAPVRAHGAGRTDAGVHAEGQVAHCDVPETRAGLDWVRALNGNLDEDVRVLAAEPVPPDFHARYAALSKTYTYRIWLSRRYVLPTRRHFVWATGPLDQEAMDAAARRLEGEHDFAAFQNTGTEVRSTVRTVARIERFCAAPGVPDGYGPATAELPEPPEGPEALEWCWRFTADGFLKQMVRNLMGCLVEVGRGRLAPDAAAAILARGDRTRAPATAPARGLCLTRVRYPA